MTERLKEKAEEFFGCEYELFVEFTGLIRFSSFLLCVNQAIYEITASYGVFFGAPNLNGTFIICFPESFSSLWIFLKIDAFAVDSLGTQRIQLHQIVLTLIFVF